MVELGAIVLVGLLVGTLCGIILRRVIAIERRVRELDDLYEALDELPDQAALTATELRLTGKLRELPDPQPAIERVSELVRGQPTAVTPEQLDPLRTQLAALATELSQCRAVLDELAAREPPQPVVELPEPDPLTQDELVREHLVADGFEVIVVGEAADGSEVDEVRLPVEARRSGVSYKGSATVEGDVVTAVSLRPAYDLFP